MPIRVAAFGLGGIPLARPPSAPSAGHANDGGESFSACRLPPLYAGVPAGYLVGGRVAAGIITHRSAAKAQALVDKSDQNKKTCGVVCKK